MKKITLISAAAFAVLPTIALAQATFNGNADPGGCVGSASVGTKKGGISGGFNGFPDPLAPSAGIQGAAIGGNGNSDGDPTNGQAHAPTTDVAPGTEGLGRGDLVKLEQAGCGHGNPNP
jgi:hypothetical protein